MKFPIIASIFGIVVWLFLSFALTTMAPVISGDASVLQLQNSDVAYGVSQTVLNNVKGNGIGAGWLILFLAAVWVVPAYRKITTAPKAVLIVPALVLGLSSFVSPSFAYYNKIDTTETVSIGTSQSAFMIPVSGANKDAQAQFGSQAYLEANKLATKRIQIPHVVVHNTGWSTPDMYVPSAILVVVNRDPFNRSWTSSKTRGTSTADEGFYFESADSLNINTDIEIAASVTEEDAAKFLYWFGTKGTSKVLAVSSASSDQDLQAAYTSVIEGKSLSDVMDTVVHGAVQASLALQFGQYNLEDGIHHKADIIKATLKDLQDQFAPKGITIQYIGYANALNYSQVVQDAIDLNYVTFKKAQTYDLQIKLVDLQSRQADVAIKNAAAGTMSKWNGSLPALPQWMFFVPDTLSQTISTWLAPSGPAKVTIPLAQK